MRSPRSFALLLTVVLCCHVIPGIARAAVRASGLLCAEAGASSVSSPDGRRLQVTNIGSSGQDGVDITLSRMSSHVMSSSTTWGPTDDGAVLSYSWGASQHNTPPGSMGQGRLSLQRVGGDVTIHSDLSEHSSSSSQRHLLYLAGDLVGDVTGPISSSFSVLSLPSSSLIPQVTYELDTARRRVVSSVSLPSGSIVMFGGQSFSCDRVLNLADLDQDGALDVCVVRYTAPATSSLSSVDFSSQATGRFDQSFSTADLDLDGSSESLHLSLPSLTVSGSLSISSSLSSGIVATGGGGGAGGLGGVMDLVPNNSLELFSPAPMLHFSRSSPFMLDATRSEDDGVSLAYRVLGTGTCSPTGEVASLRLVVSSSSLLLETQFSGVCADQETVVVLRRGLEVARFAVPVGASLTIGSPPGGSPATPVCAQGKSTQVTRSNISNNLTFGEDGVGPTAGAGAVSGTAGFSTVSSEDVCLQVEFLGDRTVCFDGTCATGDVVRVTGYCTSGTCSAITLSGASLDMHRGSSGSHGSSLDVITASPSSEDVITASVPATVAVSSHTPVVQVPVVFERSSTQAVRGTSVTLRLGTGLVLAGPIVESDYFSSHGTSQMLVVDNGGGSYTVDCALLGAGCGPTSSGTLFVLSVARAPGAPDGMSFVSVEASRAADCSAGPLDAFPGGVFPVVLDATPPPTLSSLSASSSSSGNDTDGTTKISLSFSPPGAGESVTLYRASFGNYPEYDDAPNPGSMPPAPASPPGSPWSPVTLQCSSGSSGTSSVCTDEPSSRDLYFYTGVLRDAYGNTSPSSSVTTGALNYHLGDVSNGGTECVGDNLVTIADVSALGAHYGVSLSSGSSFACLDVGPTTLGGTAGRPITDNRIAFDDLILFAVNFSLVSAPSASARPAAAPANRLHVSAPAPPAVGSTFDVSLQMEGAGDVQALSVQLGWDATVVEPIATHSGELLDLQGRGGVVLSGGPGVVDAALLGTGGGIVGRGELARVTFRVKAAGDPAVRLAGVTARDQRNTDVAVGGATAVGGGAPGTALRMAFPNPFDRATNVVLSLSQAGRADVGVFDVAGRLVRTLHEGVMSAGQHSLIWDGRDDAGRRLGAGVYLLRFSADGRTETRALRLVR